MVYDRASFHRGPRDPGRRQQQGRGRRTNLDPSRRTRSDGYHHRQRQRQRQKQWQRQGKKILFDKNAGKGYKGNGDISVTNAERKTILQEIALFEKIELKTVDRRS